MITPMRWEIHRQPTLFQSTISQRKMGAKNFTIYTRNIGKSYQQPTLFQGTISQRKMGAKHFTIYTRNIGKSYQQPTLFQSTISQRKMGAKHFTIYTRNIGKSHQQPTLFQSTISQRKMGAKHFTIYTRNISSFFRSTLSKTGYHNLPFLIPTLHRKFWQLPQHRWCHPLPFPHYRHYRHPPPPPPPPDTHTHTASLLRLWPRPCMIITVYTVFGGAFCSTLNLTGTTLFCLSKGPTALAAFTG